MLPENSISTTALPSADCGADIVNSWALSSTANSYDCPFTATDLITNSEA